MALVIHCADIGSVRRGNFGWARLAINASFITGLHIPYALVVAFRPRAFDMVD